MSGPSPAPPSRPRIVEGAFWLWLVASIMLVSFGLLQATSRGDIPVFLRGAGVIWILAGAAMGYLAGRTRRGDPRFRRAAVALSLAVVLLLALFSVMTLGWIWLVIMILTMVAAALVMRPSAAAWFDQGGQR
jgi:peptidoglycan/LPS O-acetylase OafA/YrhL